MVSERWTASRTKQRLVRVFISSTFRDMQEERDRLVRHVPRIPIDIFFLLPYAGISQYTEEYTEPTVTTPTKIETTAFTTSAVVSLVVVPLLIAIAAAICVAAGIKVFKKRQRVQPE